jgi:hypothetical protein
MKALAFKELREVFGIAAVATACYLALVINLMGAKVFDTIPAMPAGTREVPFTGPGFRSFYTLVSVLFAMALGFRQSVWESARGTFLFLLHRPLHRSAIFLTKLGTGLGIFFVCASLPILLYGWWAAIPGHQPGPFVWSMTASAWQVTLTTGLLYLGAFLSGIRPAHWFGTRLLPVVAAAIVVFFMGLLPWQWSIGLPITAIFYAILVATVCFVAKVRDYA